MCRCDDTCYIVVIVVIVVYSQTDASKQTDASASQRLLDAAKQLAAATAKMVAAGSESARNLKDPNAQEALKKAAEDLRAITTTVASQVTYDQSDYRFLANSNFSNK